MNPISNPTSSRPAATSGPTPASIPTFAPPRRPIAQAQPFNPQIFNPETFDAQFKPQDTFVNTTAWPVETEHTGIMSSDQFMTSLDQFTQQALAIANNQQGPTEEAAAKITGKKVTSKTFDYLFFGAPRKIQQARRAPRGSEQRRSDYISGGVRGVLALALSPTVFVPVVCGLAGAAKGTKDSGYGGVKRTYQRDLLKKNVLKPMLKLLKDEAPFPLAKEQRAKIREFLDTCETDAHLKRVLKPYDTKKIADWFQAQDRI